MSKYYSINEFSKILGVSAQTLRRAKQFITNAERARTSLNGSEPLLPSPLPQSPLKLTEKSFLTAALSIRYP